MKRLFRIQSASDWARARAIELCGKAGRGAVVAVAVLAVASTAGAEDTKARAQKLFGQGVEAMEKGDSATGCAKLRESLDLFAVTNTLFLVAQCDEQEGKLGTALSHWQRGLALLDAKDKRVLKAKEQMAALEPKVPRIRVIVPPGQASTTVSLDGQELSAGALEAPLLVDPGKHTLVFRAPGAEVRSREVVLAPGERTEVVATAGPPVQPQPQPPEQPQQPAQSTSQQPPEPEPQPPQQPSGSGLRMGGFVALGIGGAALIAAGITGGLALARRSDAIKNCPEVGGAPTCPASYKDQLSKDKALVVGNTVAWSVGIAGAATGAVLLLLSPRGGAKRSGVTPAPLVVAGGVGLSLTGEL